MSRTLGIRATVVAVVFGLLMTMVPVTPRSAEALDPFTAGIAIFRVFQGMARRAHTYEDIDRARNEALAQLAQERQIAHFQMNTGVLTGRDTVRELQRILKTEAAVTALTERLKKLTKRQTDKFIGSTILNAALLQLSATSGFVKTVRGVDGFLNGAEKGLAQMLANVADSGFDSLGQINAIQQQLSQASVLLDTIGGPGGRRLASHLAEIERVIAEGISKVDDIREWATQELAEALQTVQDLHGSIDTMVSDVQKWQPGGLSIDISKFNDKTTLQLLGDVNTLQGSKNAQAIIAGYAVRAMERVRVAAEGADIKLSLEDLRSIAAMAGRIYLNTRLDGRKPASWETDLFVWQALNTWLALTGRDPLDSTQFAGSWHSAAVCNEAEPGFEYRWIISVTQTPGGVVDGTISYHACDGGGRARYDVKGVATTSNSVRLTATRTFSEGPIETKTSATDFIWVTPEGAPSKQYPSPQG